MRQLTPKLIRCSYLESDAMNVGLYNIPIKKEDLTWYDMELDIPNAL